MGTNWTYFICWYGNSNTNYTSPQLFEEQLQDCWSLCEKKNPKTWKQLFVQSCPEVKSFSKRFLTCLQRNYFHDFWKDLKDKLKEKYVQGLLHWHSKQLPEWFLIKHFPYQRMHVPVPAQSEERNSQQEKMLRAQEGDLPSAPQKQDAIILLLLMSTVKQS